MQDQSKTKQELIDELSTLRQRIKELEKSESESECERMQDTLHESEERFRLAINATKDGLWEWNIQTNQEIFSPRWCEIIGYSFDDPELPHTYDSWASRIHPDDHDRVINAMKDHLEHGTEFNVDYRHCHKSGEYRWQNSRGQAVLDGVSGKPIKMVGCISDITERKCAEGQVADEKRLQQLLLDHFPGVMVLLRKDTREVVASNEAGINVGAVCESKCFATWGQSKDICPWCLADDMWATGKEQSVVLDTGEKVFEAHWVPVTDDLYLHYALDITTHRRAEEKVKEKEQIIQQALGISRSFTLDWDVKTDNVLRSESCREIFGIDSDEIFYATATSFSKYVHPDDLPQFKQLLYGLKPSSDTYRTNFRIVLSNGRIVELEETAKAYFDAAGKMERVIGVATDVTDSRRAIEALKKSQQQLALALKSSQAGTWDWDMSTQRLDWSRELYILFGLDSHVTQATFDTWDKVLHPEDKETAYDRINQAIKKKIPLYNEYRVVLPDGGIRWISALGDTTYDESGQAIRMIGICTDITDRKRAEAELQSEKNILESIIGAMTSGITIRDRDYHLIYQSPLTLDMFGNRIGEKCYQVFQKRDAICENCPVELAFQDGKSHTHITEITLPDGQISYWENTANPIRDASGVIVSCLEVSTNITERRQIEVRLKESERRLLDAQHLAHIGNWEWNLKTGETLWSQEIYEMHDMATDSPTYTPEILMQHIHPDDVARVSVVISQAISEGTPADLDYRFLCPDGSVRVIHAIGKVTEFDAEGKPYMMVGMNQDITEIKKTEGALKTFKESVENSFDAVGMATPEGLHYYQNKAFDQLFGKIKMGETPITEIFVKPEVGKEVFDAIMPGGQWTGEVKMYATDGSIRDILLRAYANSDDKGKVTSLVGIHTDITVRKQTEEALNKERVQLQQALDEVKTLRGILPICAHCKKIRDDKGYWSQVEQYVSKHTEARFSHGICPDCFEREMRELKS